MIFKLLQYRIIATYISSITFISSAYIIAGIAISALLKMKGEVAIVMACAAFCIPTSMIIVLLTAVFDFVILDNRELHSIAANIRIATVNPNHSRRAKAWGTYSRTEGDAGAECQPRLCARSIVDP